MLNKKGWRKKLNKPLALLIAVVFILNLVGCGQSEPSEPKMSTQITPTPRKPVTEVSPPKLIQTLRPSLERYQPQVTIVSPQPNQVLQDNTLNVQLEVRDLPLFKNPDLGLGPHLQLILDNQPPQTIYEIDQPIVLSDLTAGTHTLRVFAVYPWGESFKNDGAYSQTRFDVFTATPNNNPNPELPLLTYNSPQGNYGAEPILLDFYLANAPLHLVAAEDPEDEIIDWRIRVTINGESFMIDQWEPIYIDGVQPGKNWVKLEYLDQNGEPLNNVYNNTAGVFSYQPNGQDPLSKLARGEIAIAQARAIVDPTYTPGAIAPISEPQEVVEEIEPLPQEIPEEAEPTPALEDTSTEVEGEPTELEEINPETEPTPIIEDTPPTEVEVEPTEPEETPAGVEEVPEEEEIEASPKVEVEPIEVIQPDEVEAEPSVEPETQTETTETLVESTPAEELTPTQASSEAESGGIFNNISNRLKQLPFLKPETSQPTQTPLEPTPTQASSEAESGGIFKNISNRLKQLPFLKPETQTTETSVEPTSAEQIRDQLELTSDIPIEEPTPEPTSEELEATPLFEPVVEDVSEPTLDQTVEPNDLEPTPLSEPVVENVSEPTLDQTVEPNELEATPLSEPVVEDVSEPTLDQTVEPEPIVEELSAQPQPEMLSVPETVEASTPTEVEVPEAKKTPN